MPTHLSTPHEKVPKTSWMPIPKKLMSHVNKLARLSFSVLSAARPNNYLIFLLVALLLSATALTILGDAYTYTRTLTAANQKSLIYFQSCGQLAAITTLNLLVGFSRLEMYCFCLEFYTEESNITIDTILHAHKLFRASCR